MELTKVEAAAVHNAAKNVFEAVKELSELELSVIGGGMGDVTLG